MIKYQNLTFSTLYILCYSLQSQLIKNLVWGANAEVSRKKITQELHWQKHMRKISKHDDG